jgi:hypothetical protein
MKKKKKELLSEKGWFIGVLRRHLESDGWPENDAAEADRIGTGPPKKRTARLPVSKLTIIISTGNLKISGIQMILMNQIDNNH